MSRKKSLILNIENGKASAYCRKYSKYIYDSNIIKHKCLKRKRGRKCRFLEIR